MGELTIRRNKGFAAVPRQTAVEKSEKTSGGGQTQKTADKGTGLTVSETIRQSMSRETEALSRESRRTLQSGEAVLSEVQNTLDRIAELAKESAGGEPDRAALQQELDRLQKEIDRMTGSAFAGDAQLFLDAGADTASGIGSLPDWLMQGIGQNTPTAEQVLRALGLDKTASGAALLAAVTGSSPGRSSAAGYVAALYLGAVIAGGSQAQPIDPTQALDGLRRLMEAVDDGMSPDEALEMLTNGEFTSFEEFQSQFADGTLPGMEDFLSNLLLAEGNASLLDGLSFSLPSLLEMMDGTNFDLLMGLMDAMQSGESLLEFGATTEATAGGNVQETVSPEAGSAPVNVMQFGDVQVVGRDLSGVSFNAASGELTIDGSADVVVQGTGQGRQAILIAGSGTVTLQNVHVSTLTASASAAHIFSTGENVLGEVLMQEGVSLTVKGGGLLRIGSLRGNESNALHLSGGAVVLGENGGKAPGVLTVPVTLDGIASLAAQAGQVRSFDGKALEPFDILWKALLPGFGSLTSMALDGRQAKMLLFGGEHPDPARLWLEKGDLSSHGYPAHRLVIRGRDEAGRPMTRYAYLYWNQRTRAFEASDMYPNPFTVTGGEPGQDWVYEEASCTLRILSPQVSAISGGSGTDAEQTPFSGRIALADRIGPLALALDGVVCRVSAGRAFDLGRENDVTLILQSGTSNYFESGAGGAGISLGEGTSLRIDCAGGSPAGTLTASGGVGIGRDGDRKQTGRILIRGGAVTGTEKREGVESVTVVGGMSATAKGGTDTGSARVLSRMGISLRIGDDTVILPQFRLSANSLRLDGLDVSTKDFAKAAMLTLEADKRWVHRLQRVYENLSSRMENSVIRAAGGADDTPVRDNAAASSLLEGMSRAIPLSSAQAMRTHGSRNAAEVSRLLRK